MSSYAAYMQVVVTCNCACGGVQNIIIHDCSTYSEELRDGKEFDQNAWIIALVSA